MTIKVLLVDDQALVRTGLRMIIDAHDDLRVVGEAADGRAGVAEARRVRPDVALMDVRMPVMDGIEATRALLQLGEEHPKVIVLTTFDLDEHVVDALEAGASGFLLKDAPAEMLVEGIRVVARGDALLAPSVTKRLLHRYVGSRPRLGAEATARLASLTAREREVLELVAAGLSNDEIAEALFIGDTTVKTHVSRVLTKLQLRDRVQAVVFAYESGIVRPGGA